MSAKNWDFFSNFKFFLSKILFTFMLSKNISISQSNALLRFEIAFTIPSFVSAAIAFSAKSRNSSDEISYIGILISEPLLPSRSISSIPLSPPSDATSTVAIPLPH